MQNIPLSTCVVQHWGLTFTGRTSGKPSAESMFFRLLAETRCVSSSASACLLQRPESRLLHVPGTDCHLRHWSVVLFNLSSIVLLQMTTQVLSRISKHTHLSCKLVCRPLIDVGRPSSICWTVVSANSSRLPKMIFVHPDRGGKRMCLCSFESSSSLRDCVLRM